MTGMKGILRALIVAVLAAAILGGCAETALPEATGKGTINMINAMPASPSVGFLIEERVLGSVGYKVAHGPQPFDDLTYNFNFEYLVLGGTGPIRTATVLLDVVADNEHTFVLTGSVTAPDVTVWERPQRVWDGAETVFERKPSSRLPSRTFRLPLATSTFTSRRPARRPCWARNGPN